MLKVFKYPIKIDDRPTIDLPRGAKILRGDSQNNNFVIWALVNPENTFTTRHLRLAGTGHPIEEPMDKLIYINTFYSTGGLFVWHLFEIIQ